MKATHFFHLLPIVFLMQLVTASAGPGRALNDSVMGFSPAQAELSPTVTLHAASGATITFKPHNGEPQAAVPAQTMDLPHLVLYRNGVLTDPRERTLIVELSGIEVPPAGVTVTLKLETQHGNPDLGGGSEHRIAVERESQHIANAAAIPQTGAAAVFTYEFSGTLPSGTAALPTPTDYLRYELAVLDAHHPISNPLLLFYQDHALLLENQWTATLPKVDEASDGAAPDELIVYYCDMFPIQKSGDEDTSWLLREAVPDFIQSELVPAMIEAFRFETNDWRFPWHQAWTSYRSDDNSERLSVALTQEGTWYHGRAPYPAVGHAAISLRVDARHNAAYDTPAGGLMATFYHELFHNLQRDILQYNGGDSDVDGASGAWGFFSEGTAVLAPSVAQGGAQFAQTSTVRDYMGHANWFLGHACLQGDLNRSYAELNPYHAAVYWRFLYEQCGGMQGGVEDPAVGMDIIHRALTALYSRDIVDIGASTNLVGAMPRIMDQALAEASCPFKTYGDSLAAFARAIYALQLEGGRCLEPRTPEGCGFYDPHHLYHDPPVSTLTYTGTPITYDAGHQAFPTGISSSYGMDFVDVILDPSVNGQSITLEFYGVPGAAAEFNVQLWKLMDAEGGTQRQSITPYTVTAEVLTEMSADGHQIYVIPEIATTEYNRLGLIITRVDANEDSDPIGEYTIALRSDFVQ